MSNSMRDVRNAKPKQQTKNPYSLNLNIPEVSETKEASRRGNPYQHKEPI